MTVYVVYYHFMMNIRFSISKYIVFLFLSHERAEHWYPWWVQFRSVYWGMIQRAECPSCR